MEDKLPDMNTAEEVTSYSRFDHVFVYIVLLLGFCFIRFVLWNVTGFFTTLFFIATMSACLAYLRRSKFHMNKFHIFLCVLILLFSLVFSITANRFIKFLDFNFVTLLGIYWVYSICSEKNTVERFFVFSILKAAIIMPFTDFTRLPKVIAYSSKRSKTSNNIRLAFLGLIVTIPLTLMVAGLLISADKGVKDMLGMFFDNISVKCVEIIMQFMLGIPVALYLFGMLFSNVRKAKKDLLTDEQCEKGLKQLQVTPNIAVYSAVTPICFLYALFFISQVRYFIAAFGGNLPQDYSYAEYARRGFFELCVISVINLMVLVFISLLPKQGGENKPVILKLYSAVLSVFTLLIISTAVSKMVMYIGQYGLTQLRVYTSWFMILLAVIFVLIIIKQFHFKFHIAKYALLSFVIMFGVLCFSNIDRNIARYNIRMHQAGKLEDLDLRSICSTSDDGMLYAVQNGINAGYYLGDKLEMYKSNPYSTYNLSSLQLKRLLEKND
ncbi:DUF4153 domain-containing protein [Clostridium sp. Marseille-P2415]|uniref:DUF4153 domain-containing protein n=1 Tax=Clostridium sp. Marseille-P2415 TaxID=1805471 RepID=UPI0009885057|nr:DUF4173 domain-containing protein [Clostridium sp. Marseille-P2415]